MGRMLFVDICYFNSLASQMGLGRGFSPTLPYTRGRRLICIYPVSPNQGITQHLDQAHFTVR